MLFPQFHLITSIKYLNMRCFQSVRLDQWKWQPSMQLSNFSPVLLQTVHCLE